GLDLHRSDGRTPHRFSILSAASTILANVLTHERITTEPRVNGSGLAVRFRDWRVRDRIREAAPRRPSAPLSTRGQQGHILYCNHLWANTTNRDKSFDRPATWRLWLRYPSDGESRSLPAS